MGHFTKYIAWRYSSSGPLFLPMCCTVLFLQAIYSPSIIAPCKLCPTCQNSHICHTIHDKYCAGFKLITAKIQDYTFLTRQYSEHHRVHQWFYSCIENLSYILYSEGPMEYLWNNLLLNICIVLNNTVQEIFLDDPKMQFLDLQDWLMWKFGARQFSTKKSAVHSGSKPSRTGNSEQSNSDHGNLEQKMENLELANSAPWIQHLQFKARHLVVHSEF